jgi:hypothetical protein
MKFESLKEEQAFDHSVSEWIRFHRFPGTAALALIMQRAYSNLKAAGLPPSPSALELAYRQLHAEGAVGIYTEPLAIPPADPEKTLTKEQYEATPASENAKKYLNNFGGWYRAAVDELVRLKQI